MKVRKKGLHWHVEPRALQALGAHEEVEGDGDPHTGGQARPGDGGAATHVLGRDHPAGTLRDRIRHRDLLIRSNQM